MPLHRRRVDRRGGRVAVEDTGDEGPAKGRGLLALDLFGDVVHVLPNLRCFLRPGEARVRVRLCVRLSRLHG